MASHRISGLAALIKSEKSSPNINRLISDAERVSPDAPEFPTIAHELIRLQIALEEKAAARTLIDAVISKSAGVLPISAKNQFLQQRAHLADAITDFLKYSQRTPVAFYNDENGRFGSLSELLEIEKADWDDRYADERNGDDQQQRRDDPLDGPAHGAGAPPNPASVSSR